MHVDSADVHERLMDGVNGVGASGHAAPCSR